MGLTTTLLHTSACLLTTPCTMAVPLRFTANEINCLIFAYFKDSGTCFYVFFVDIAFLYLHLALYRFSSLCICNPDGRKIGIIAKLGKIRTQG